MRICSCGGRISEGELTSGRTRWECHECGRYEIFTRAPIETPLPVQGDLIDQEDGGNA